jgi:hypothetical protein
MTDSGEPTLLLKLSDKESIGFVLTSINNATELRGADKLPTYDKTGTSTHLLEIYGIDNSMQKVYIALEPDNRVQGVLKKMNNTAIIFMKRY